MLEYRFDTQLLIEGHDLDEDAIHDYLAQNIPGDCLIAVGDEDLIKIHYHTNLPWKVLEYGASLGDIHDIVVENMDRQSSGLQKGPSASPSGESGGPFHVTGQLTSAFASGGSMGSGCSSPPPSLSHIRVTLPSRLS